jgi:hypothetical protein
MFDYQKIIQPNTYIRCSTEEQANTLLEWAHTISSGRLCWSDGDAYTCCNNFNKRNDFTAYNLYYGTIMTLESQNRTIINYEDALLKKNDTVLNTNVAVVLEPVKKLNLKIRPINNDSIDKGDVDMNRIKAKVEMVIFSEENGKKKLSHLFADEISGYDADGRKVFINERTIQNVVKLIIDDNVRFNYNVDIIEHDTREAWVKKRTAMVENQAKYDAGIIGKIEYERQDLLIEEEFKGCSSCITYEPVFKRLVFNK